MSDNNLTALLAGATAGFIVDISMFPIDTIKTRIQSAEAGIRRKPGSLHLFSGLPIALIGSVPSASTFFFTYELTKRYLEALGWNSLCTTVFAASLAEVAACSIRVPCEVFKQRAQNAPGTSLRFSIRKTFHEEGFKGMYRGYLSTVLREIPFSMIQFPIWEQLRRICAQWNDTGSVRNPTRFASAHELTFFQSAVCGSVSGAIAGALTTPLDVAKTRTMLAEANSPLASAGTLYALSLIFRERGVRGIFAGLAARVTYLAIGGFLFLGTYDISRTFWSDMLATSSS